MDDNQEMDNIPAEPQEIEPTESEIAAQEPAPSQPPAQSGETIPEPVSPTPEPPPQAIQQQPASTYQQASPPPQYAPKPAKDRSLTLLLEILPALFGIFGIGWIYSGNTGVGIAWLIGVLIWEIIAAIIAVFSGFLACFCLVPINLALLAVTAITLNNYTKQHPEIFGPQP